MRVEFFLEEPSAAEPISALAPQLLRPGVGYRCHVFNGKPNLLRHLPARLRGLRSIPADWRIVVLVDEDREDCIELKRRLEQIARDAGFGSPATSPAHGPFVVLNRIAVEELEAWYFGDPEAIQAAYPRFRRHHARKADLVNPDACTGGTWEAFERTLQKAGYYTTGLPKKEAARRMGAEMLVPRNRSPSFRTFVAGLAELQSR